MNCEFNEINENFTKITNEMQSKIDQSNIKNEAFVIGLICGEEFKDQMNHFISESASTLTKCIDPNYLNHIDKLKTVALRSINVLCESQEQLISSSMNLKSNQISNIICGLKNKLQLTGCVFSQDEVREIIADRSLISNFTLEVLDGTYKKCGTLNEIQMCFIKTFEKCVNREFINSFKQSTDMIFKFLHCKNNMIKKL